MPDYERIRAAQERLLTDTATITGEDGVVKASNVPARLSGTGYRPDERVIAGRLGAVTSYTITLPHDAVAVEGDRIAISGRTFKVIGVLRPSNLTALRCVCAEVI